MKQNNHTFIDSKTYEIIPDSKIIEVDDEIAKTISILNKKGYKTKYCCSGHINEYNYRSQILDISLLNEEELKRDYSEYYIEDITKNNFKLITPKEICSIYIMFENNYEFATLPKGFVKSIDTDNNLIEHIINYYEASKLRDAHDVYNEIKEYNKLLEDWANNLPYRN